MPLLVTILLTALIYIFVGVAFKEKGIGFEGAIYVALFAAVYTMVANIFYWTTLQKTKLKSAGASIGLRHWLPMGRG